MDDDRRTNSSTPDQGHAIAPQAGAAERALAEADARRREQRRIEQRPRPREVNGRQGPEPVRYGDWENKGIACDF